MYDTEAPLSPHITIPQKSLPLPEIIILPFPSTQRTSHPFSRVSQLSSSRFTNSQQFHITYLFWWLNSLCLSPIFHHYSSFSDNTVSFYMLNTSSHVSLFWYNEVSSSGERTTAKKIILFTSPLRRIPKRYHSPFMLVHLSSVCFFFLSLSSWISKIITNIITASYWLM